MTTLELAQSLSIRLAPAQPALSVSASSAFMQVDKGLGRRQAGDRRALQLPDWRGELQLALPVSVSVPARREADGHHQEGEHLFLGEDGV